MSLSILIVAYAAHERDLLARVFETRGDTVRTAASASEGRMAFAEHAPDVALVALPLPDDDAAGFPNFLLDEDPQLGVLLVGDDGADRHSAVLAARRGALLLQRPLDMAAVLMLAETLAETRRIRYEVTLRRRDDRALAPLPHGVDMLIDLASRTPQSPVLLVGEAGTGKGIVARLVHDLSPRADAPFLEVEASSAAALTFERRIFGSERGGVPSDPSPSPGMLELADRGTVLIRSAARVPYETQGRVLRFIEEGEFSRLGGSVVLRSDARILVATERPLAPSVDAGIFRSDLFYRLQVLTIALPPLRERREELERIAAPFLPDGSSLSDDALDVLREYDWPGNIRELRDTLWRAARRAGPARRITPYDLFPHLDTAVEPAPHAPVHLPPDKVLPLAEVERNAILAAMQASGGNKKGAARLLGIARSTLHDKLKRL